ncbi:hypothetical protein F3Y22_tig00110610pilonHSYRG00496 [Hibiscus syriacus]|uniref:Ubiquitin-like protease family profile domain-containing protein n=1 Tax=Hibiscus syriacus TaxID=106335 RepID=A0A6A3A3V5_HIBSY|nr:hypothetical protein F3Y22_tig00110610pilonHSYRG00496 [Hibiscus syriacus]
MEGNKNHDLSVNSIEEIDISDEDIITGTRFGLSSIQFSDRAYKQMEASMNRMVILKLLGRHIVRDGVAAHASICQRSGSTNVMETDCREHVVVELDCCVAFDVNAHSAPNMGFEGLKNMETAAFDVNAYSTANLCLDEQHGLKNMESDVNFYSAQLTLRNKVSLAKTIASKLSPAQRKMFEDTCFGPWLKVQHPGGDAMLTHLGPIRWMLYVGFSLHDGVHASDGVDVLLRLRSPQWCEDSARISPTHRSSLKSPLQSFKRPLFSLKIPPTVQEATVIVEEVPPTIPEPDSHGVIYRSIEKPPPVPDMMDESWLSYELPASTLPVSEVERRQLPETIVDNTLWAKTAVDFYLHERSQGCYTDISKLNDEMFLLLDRSWWGVLLGVEDSGYLDGEVFIPVLERHHWLLVQLQLPSLKIIVYDSMINYISLSDLRDIFKGWSSHLAKFLDGIKYWSHSGHKKPKKFNVTVVRDETAPQQSPGARGDCGPLLCLCLARLTMGSTEFLPPTDRDRAAVGLWFRHYMARVIYSRRCLPASAL